MKDSFLWDRIKLKKALKDDLIYIDNSYKYSINNVVFDNRKVSENSLFIAKKGENNDGHNFIEATLKKNSNVFILANYNCTEKFKNNPRVILVKDTVLAMEKMARYARKTVRGIVVGITGSLGKTTTKELFNSCFSNFGKSYCNIMSFNNYFGVLTTLCNLPQDTDYATIEMGMNSKGEMEKLSEIIKPDITIILNVASAHLAFFKKEENIAYAKSEIFKYQNKNGFTILNADSQYIDIMKKEAKKNEVNSILTFSEKEKGDIKLKKYYENNNRYKAIYELNDKNIEYSFNSPDYNVAVNLMSLLLILNKLNLDFKKIENSIENFGTPRGRNNIEEANFDGKHITLINGTYNAVNPLAFITGLKLMSKISKNKRHNRKIAIFGDIREAGEKAEEFMLSLKEHILEHKIDILIGVGETVKVLCDSLKNKIKVEYFKESSEIVPIIKDILQNEDLLFIKASKGIKTWKILDTITGYPTEIFV